MKDFPELATEPHEKLRKLDEEWMKSADGKKRWRKFIESWVASHPRLRYRVNAHHAPPDMRARSPTTILALSYARMQIKSTPNPTLSLVRSLYRRMAVLLSPSAVMRVQFLAFEVNDESEIALYF